MKIIPSEKVDMEEIIVFWYKNSETKTQNPLSIKISEIENNTFWTNLSGRDYCVPEKEIQNVILYILHFLRVFLSFPL